jgi:two-component SAPR family response regulator
MKAREIRERLKGKVEPELLVVLEAIGEHISAQSQETSTLAEIQNRTIDLIMSLGGTIEVAANAVDELKKIREG